MFGDYYLDMDIRSGRVYIATRKLDKNHLYLILMPNRYEAEKFLKDLNFGRKLDPLKAPMQYQLLEKIEEKMGELNGVISIYGPISMK